MPEAPRRLYIGLIGPGLVGKEFLRQLHARFPALNSQTSTSTSSFSVELLFVATSKRVAFVQARADPGASVGFHSDWKTLLNADGVEAELKRVEWKRTRRACVVSCNADLSSLPGHLPLREMRQLVLKNGAEEGPSPAVLVDCSASSSVPEQVYEEALRLGISVVTPNKSFAAGPASGYESALAAAARWVPPPTVAGGPPPPRPLYLGEATVGAGLPVLSTLRDFLATGDRVKKIEGVFSDSLSFIFNTLFSSDGDGAAQQQASPPPLTLASVVRRAKELGYTEPDPRDDLAGVDVARKAVILARALSRGGERSAGSAAGGGSGSSGAPPPPPCPFPPRLIELSDVPVRSLVPPHLSDRSAVDVEAFLRGLESDDGGVGAEIAKAKLEGKVLRFVGSVTCDYGDDGDGDGDDGTGGGAVVPVVKAEVALRAFARDHPYAGLSGADNVFSFVTDRYAEASPLVIRGPGAGAAVTAAGVFGDLLTVARAAGANV